MSVVPRAATVRGVTQATAPAPQRAHTAIDLDSRPMLVFWEATKACLLACRHCRAEAHARPAEGELSTEDGKALIGSLAAFGRPSPILVITGGDACMRPDLLDLVRHAAQAAVPVALAPSVTPLLSDERLSALRRLGVRVASLSLDGATAETHEGVRQVEGHFAQTLDALARLRRHGFVVQVNTVAMAENVHELPAVARIVRDAGAAIWEVFFLVQVGRGTAMSELTPWENEDVCHFLYDASRYGFVVRTVEGPFFRRVFSCREANQPFEPGPLYERLRAGLERELGSEPCQPSKAQTKGTRDGRGIVFVSATGDVTPAGFLPIVLGNVRERALADIYRHDPLLREIRAGRFRGRCGECGYRTLCGGSRSRAFAATGDPLGEDPACAYVPS